ncbi:MAG: hypothetical protein JL50_01165 [Peptococcaceae bacterium BICA1-7]|nr:MAG: hypothetical protein JL50_01165 [Peptococcaceae bacterium BICA1-7]HBV98001.1 ABC transporter ATP-binding protein [Desulfotomaculum sp.]
MNSYVKIKFFLLMVIMCSFIGAVSNPKVSNASQLTPGYKFILAVYEAEPVSGQDQVQDHQGQDTETDKVDENEGLIDSIKDLVNGMESFTENVSRILKGDLMDVISEWMGKQLDKFFKNVNGLLGTAFIYTPPLHTISWMHSCWSFFFWISIALIVLVSVIAVGSFFSAKGEGDIYEPIKVIFVAFVLAVASFYLIDFAIFLTNKMTTSIVQGTVDHLQGLGCSVRIGDPMTGDLIVKLMFTPDAAFGSNSGEAAPLYNVLINSGGIILLFIGYPLLFLVALASLARYMLIAILAIGSPAWHVGGSISGRMETMVGFWYQIGRLMAMEVMAGFTWMACTKIQLAEIGKLQIDSSTGAAIQSSDVLGVGISATFAVTVIILIYLVVSCVFVWKTSVTLLKEPVSLGGAGVMLGFSKAGGMAASAGRSLSKRFDNPTWERRSMKLGEAAKRAGETGKRWAEQSSGPWKNKVSSALGSSVTNADKVASAVSMNENPYQIDSKPVSAPDSGGQTVSWTSIKVIPADRASLLAGISASHGANIVKQHSAQNDRILVEPGQINNVIRYLDKVYADKIRYWSDGTDYVTIENGLPVVRKSPPAGGVHMGPWKR